MGKINLERALEIASQVIDGLIEDDRESAIEYLDDIVELTSDEKEYFGVYKNEADKFLSEIVMDPTMSLEDMFAEVNDSKFVNELYVGDVYTYNELKNRLIVHIQKNHKCIELFEAIQDNYSLYMYNDDAWECGATPIENKEELKGVLMNGAY